ncbi:MAG: hypothetical protein KC619_14505 [Myxococcales bacterium]|nr:hypothetical protein [Myxococcales bacterium]
MRAHLSLVLLLAGCTCEGVGGEDPNEAAARARLERAGLSEVVLERVDERTFDFTGTREGHACTGTVMVNPRPGGTSTSAMQLECE